MRPKRFRHFLASALTSVVALSSSGFAVTQYWDGTDTTANGASDNANTAAQNWLSGGNWDNGTSSAPIINWTAGDSAVFGGSAATQTITGGTLTIGDMTFGSGGDGSGTTGTAYTVNGGSITVGTTNITTNTDATIGSALTGAGSVTKEGAGILTFSSRKDYTGGTIVNAGILDITGGGVNGPGAIRGTATVNAGATLRLSSTDATGYNTDATRLGVINLVGGTLNVNTTGNQTLGSAVINMTGGTISGIANSNLDFFANGSAVNTFESATTSTISIPSISLRQDDTVFTVADGVAASDLTISSRIGNGSQGNHNMIKEGAGKMTLTNGGNTFTGNITVNAGILEGISNAGAVYGAANGTRSITVNNSGTLSMSGNNNFGGSTRLLADTPKIIVNAGGTVTNSGYNVIGNIDLNGGILTATGGSNGTTYQSYEFNGSTITVGGTTASTISRTGANTGMHIAGNKTLTLDVGDVTTGTDLTVSAVLINGSNDRAGAGSLLKTGAGTADLSVNNSYTGGTIVNAGVLNLTGGGGGSGTIRGTATVNTGATLRLSTGDATGFNADANSLRVINLNGGTLDVNTTANQTLGGAVITMTGAKITGIAGSNIDFFRNGSAVTTLASATTSEINVPTINLRQDDTVFDIADGAAATDLLINSAIGNGNAGNHNMIKNGAGSMVLSATSSYTGTTSVNAGMLIVNGNISTSVSTTVASGASIGGGGTLGAVNVQSGGFINPGNSPGILNTGDLTLAGTYNMELAGATAGTGYDRINVTGSVSLGGSLNLIATFTPLNGSLFFILNNDGTDAIGGTFAGLSEGATFTDNLSNQYQITYLADFGTTSFTNGNDIALMVIPEPGVALLGSLSLLALLRRRR